MSCKASSSKANRVIFHTLAIFAFITMLIAAALIPAAYFGDKNMAWTNRLIVIAGVSAAIVIVELIRWIF